ncbi:hypothetical protein PR048_025294 [Dryococelus australis]|uniref:Uncharacterized protein n=1 Tax=Dryococelus australis TaxID=614101 RepID=A0ABQ9GQZ6_9NEOP|nr:hypothetical protein PR048_025294 [Dryococelus australis]
MNSQDGVVLDPISSESIMIKNEFMNYFNGARIVEWQKGTVARGIVALVNTSNIKNSYSKVYADESYSNTFNIEVYSDAFNINVYSDTFDIEVYSYVFDVEIGTSRFIISYQISFRVGEYALWGGNEGPGLHGPANSRDIRKNPFLSGVRTSSSQDEGGEGKWCREERHKQFLQSAAMLVSRQPSPCIDMTLDICSLDFTGHRHATKGLSTTYATPSPHMMVNGVIDATTFVTSTSFTSITSHGRRYAALYISRLRHDGNPARLARRSDEALEVRVSVTRIAPSLLCLGRAHVDERRRRTKKGEPRENPTPLYPPHSPYENTRLTESGMEPRTTEMGSQCVYTHEPNRCCNRWRTRWERVNCALRTVHEPLANRSSRSAWRTSDVYKSKWFTFEELRFLEDRDSPRKRLNTNVPVPAAKRASRRRRQHSEADSSQFQMSWIFPSEQGESWEAETTVQGIDEEEEELQDTLQPETFATPLHLPRNQSAEGEKNLISYPPDTRKADEHAVFDILMKADTGYYERPAGNFRLGYQHPYSADMNNIVPHHSPTVFDQTRFPQPHFDQVHHDQQPLSPLACYSSSSQAPTCPSTLQSENTLAARSLPSTSQHSQDSASSEDLNDYI